MLSLARRSPLEWFEQMKREMDEMFRGWFDSEGASVAAWAPACDVYTTSGTLVIRCDVPGVDPGDVHVNAQGRTLTISGERKPSEPIPDDDYWYRGIAYGSFTRSITLPAAIDGGAVKATHRNGVLHIEVPLPADLSGREVPISVEPPALAASTA